jgi:glycosyltransferase involved in cell wall biosynthesis
MTRWTDGLLEFSDEASRKDQRNFDIASERILRVSPAVDLDRFDPGRVRRDMRESLGVKPNEVLVGIVARMQRHRRFQVLLEAMASVKRQDPSIRLMILGRGTYQDSVAKEPARRLGLTDNVTFPGYRTEDYVDYVGAMDIKVFLVPGSDGTCRAVREAMALGKPVIAAKRGMLPELVEHGVSGLVVDDTPEALARAILELAKRPVVLRRQMGEIARKKANKEFDPVRQARQVGTFYEAVLRSGRLPGR